MIPSKSEASSIPYHVAVKKTHLVRYDAYVELMGFGKRTASIELE